jgi:uncharacterized protein (DUF1330 family)
MTLGCCQSAGCASSRQRHKFRTTTKKEQDMPAYFVAIQESVQDPEEMKVYSPKARASLEKFEWAMKAYGGRLKVLEGDPMEQVVIIEFPSFDKAQEWYDSPAYQDAIQHRLRGAKFRTFITEGL